PEMPDANALLISVGIIGATVMPHALYLHSGLTQARAKVQSDKDRRQLVRYSNREVIVALAIAGMVNMAMVIMAASTFHGAHNDIAEIDQAYYTLTPLLGIGAAGVFLVSLIVSGISSSVVGTMAGQMVMQGFVGFYIPIWVRRLVTMIPAFIVVALGVNSTEALVVSQVILSISLPVPMIALLYFSGRKSIMGQFSNGIVTQIVAILSAIVVLILNFVLLFMTFGLIPEIS
ncbi:Nramp family divalent metal transporter, partial [Bartonella apis]